MSRFDVDRPQRKSMMKRFFGAVAFVLFAHGALAQVADDAAIRKILADRIDQQHASVGIVAGVIDTKGRRVVTNGSMAMV
jgi:hypothetical protein